MAQDSFERLLVTSALPYANGPIHIGHLAGAYLPADLFVRYQRMKGRDVVFICGSDELGVAIMIRAQKEGITPKQIVDEYHPRIEASFRRFGMSFDYYGRTTSDCHRETTQDFFRRLASKGTFTLQTEKQLYDPKANIFLADRFVRGTCPICGHPDAYGDQCENCGSTLSPKELIDPKSAITDTTPELRETTHWYLPLGRFQSDLEKWIATHPEWKTNVLGQIRSWFSDGLKDRAITRDIAWGVPVPEDVARQEGVDATGKAIYVWFDAPIGYVSFTREWAEGKGDPDLWRRYWQDEGTRLVHFVGKDNIVFHCIMFPAMLMAHGEYVLPENVPANEFLNIEGRKLSTSRGWAVWLDEYLDEFKPDLLRYALGITLPETKDGDFVWQDFQTHVNSELADVLGNFVNRTLTFATRYFDGRVPELVDPSETDLDVLARIAAFPGKIGHAYETHRNREAIFETMNLARMGNKYFNDTEPWRTRKSDIRACGNTIHVSLQICASLSVLMEPVMPDSAGQLREMLKLDAVRSSMPEENGGTIGWDAAGTSLLETGHKLGEPGILFTKIEDEVIQKQIDKLRMSEAENQPQAGEEKAYTPLADQIEFDDFTKLDLRAGIVVAADAVPKSDKLLRMEVDLGFEKRQILAGIAQQYRPEDLVGKRVVALANLKPRKMFGLESQGMLLMAEDRNGKLTFLAAGESEPGSTIS